MALPAIYKMKEILVLIILLILFSITYSQSSTYYNKGTGYGYLTIYENGGFLEIGGVGLASSIIDTGTYRVKDNFILLTYTKPTLVNGVDSVANIGHYNQDRDTLIVIDSLTLGYKKRYDTSLYVLIEQRSNGINKEYHWIFKEHTLQRGNILVFINHYPFRVGDWKEYYSNGKLKSLIQYENGLKHGLQLEYHENGNIKRFGKWSKGHMYGIWTTYDKYGKTIMSEKIKKSW